MEVRLKKKVVFEETELRLGLPGNGSEGAEVVRKRGFCDTDHETDQSTLTTVDLMLNLSSKSKEATSSIVDPSVGDEPNHTSPKDHKSTLLLPSHPAKPPAAKAQAVGWPPVRSFRKNMFAVQKRRSGEESEKKSPNASFVKVSMDGAPYLRKVDLKMYKSYPELSDALGKMFSSFTNGNCESQGMKDFMNESKLVDLLNSSDYVPTYEDKDGDWMLVRDVPWEMFVESCKRLRIMKGKEAIGLAPRAMEKCRTGARLVVTGP